MDSLSKPASKRYPHELVERYKNTPAYTALVGQSSWCIPYVMDWERLYQQAMKKGDEAHG